MANNKKATKKKTKLNKKLIIKKAIISILILAILGGLGYFIAYQCSKVDAGKYVNETITYYGFENYGRVDKYETVNFEELANALDIEDVEDIKNCVNIEMTKINSLKNGDEIKCVITFDYNSINKLKTIKNLKGDEKYEITYKVENLREMNIDILKP